MDFIGIFCGITFALVSFGALTVIVLFISCDRAAEREQQEQNQDDNN
jgi:hypothetical protein